MANKKVLSLTILAATAVLYFSLEQAPLTTIAAEVPEPLPQSVAEDIPKPRAPALPRITSVDQLVPFAKIILQRDYHGQRLGWGIRGGERVLFIVSHTDHPWVVQAFVKAFKELRCLVDLLVQDRPQVRYGSGTKEWADEALRLMKERLSQDLNSRPSKLYPSWSGSGLPRPRSPGVRLPQEYLQQYDVIVGPVRGPRNQPGLAAGLRWVSTPEKLASPRIIYPGELLDFIDQKGWEVIRNAERVEVTGLQGTKFSFTWFPEWWEIVEGTHPKIRSAGDSSTFNSLHSGRSEFPVFGGHLLVHPRYSAIEGSDAEGVIVAEQGDWGMQWPPLALHLERGEVVKVENGGFYGDFWRKSLELTKDIQYPGYSRPGTGWFTEFALGTNPKVFGPMRVKELEGVDGRDPRDIGWNYARDRTGIVHGASGVLGSTWWAEPNQMPVAHYHQRFYFLTYDVTTNDGRKVRLIDKGHLTLLDDPEVRAFAAKFGDPDELLTEDWVPGLTPEGRLFAPESRLVPYDEWVRNLPFKLDDPRLIYRMPDKLKKFYGEDRVAYYNHEELMDFYRKLGQIPVKRVK